MSRAFTDRPQLPCPEILKEAIAKDIELISEDLGDPQPQLHAEVAQKYERCLSTLAADYVSHGQGAAEWAEFVLSRLLYHKSVAPPKSETEEGDSQKDIAEFDALMVQPSAKPNFDSVMGMDELKSKLTTAISGGSTYPDHQADKSEAGSLTYLLAGPPGTGKTYFAKALANQFGMILLSVTPAQVKGMYQGESEKKIRAVFEAARRRSIAEPDKGVLLFLDELDGIVQRRKADTDAIAKGMLTEFLPQMDAIRSDPDSKVVVIGNTNQPMDLDGAAVRRFLPIIVDVEVDLDAVQKMFKFYIKNAPFRGDDFGDLNTAFNGPARVAVSKAVSSSGIADICKKTKNEVKAQAADAYYFPAVITEISGSGDQRKVIIDLSPNEQAIQDAEFDAAVGGKSASTSIIAYGSKMISIVSSINKMSTPYFYYPFPTLQAPGNYGMRIDALYTTLRSKKKVPRSLTPAISLDLLNRMAMSQPGRSPDDTRAIQAFRTAYQVK